MANRGPQPPAQQVLAQQVITQGPLPVAQEFAGYNATLPGAADRILKMAENEAKERQANTRAIVRSQVFQNYVGPVAGFLVAALALYFGYDLAKGGSQVVGFASIATGAFSMVGSVISALRKQPRP